VERIGIDVSLAALPYEELAIHRAASIELLPQLGLRLYSPEDLVIMKLFAGRETDLRDARSVLVRQGGGLDWNYIETQLAEFEGLKEGSPLTEQLRLMRASIHSA
jgi:hypothetical protein